MTDLRAPFPWFGGKSRVAADVWERFGEVHNYVEPFAGSLAVLLGRPHTPATETVNDLDCYLANFWRALTLDPGEVARWADWPVNEIDLHARHKWLHGRDEFRELMRADPDYFDAKIAGWWVWGISMWIGSGWCSRPDWDGRVNAGREARGIATIGSNARHMDYDAKWNNRPVLSSAGEGIHRKRPDLNSGKGIHVKRLALSGRGDGFGINAERIALAEQKPGLAGDTTAPGRGIFTHEIGMNIYGYFSALMNRLRRVRVCCGDWTRVCTPSVTFKHGVCGVFLDPPYDMRVVSDAESGRDGAAPSDGLYTFHDNDLSAKVRWWALENGNNPLLRIALCGYEGEHEMPESWECVAWKARGGYGSQGDGRGRDNATRERIWFSPHCLKEGPLFRL